MLLGDTRVQRVCKGQTAMELGLALVLLVVLFLGMVDAGHLLFHAIILENVVREGLWQGIRGLPDARIVEGMQNALGPLDPSRLRWSITPADGQADRQPGSLLTVELWYDDRVPCPFPGVFETPFPLHVCRRGKIL